MIDGLREIDILLIGFGLGLGIFFLKKKHWPELNGKSCLSDQVNKYNKYKDQSEQPVYRIYKLIEVI